MFLRIISQNNYGNLGILYLHVVSFDKEMQWAS